MLRILDFLFPPREDETALRAVSLDTFLAFISPRLDPATRPGTAALLSFSRPEVRAAIHEAKYHGSTRAFELLGSTIAEYLRDTDEQSKNLVIIPVPLGKKRRKERGFNQTEEIGRLALRLLREDNIRLDTTILVRTRETASQVSLPREERERNMRGAFRAAHPADPRCTYIVIDDVLTTGATLQAAIDALKTAGAVNIIPLALAH